METIELDNKRIAVRLSARAERAAAQLQAPLVAEMELYFSCLIRKAVRFKPLSVAGEAVPVRGNLYLRFRPVVSRSCGVKVADGPPPLTDLSIVNPTAYTPDWLDIDFRHGEWVGRFGYGRS